MELVLLALALLTALGAALGATALVTAAVVLWYGQFYWQAAGVDRARPWVRAWRLGDWLRTWFQFSIKHQIPGDARYDTHSGPVLFACAPHGMLVVSAWLGFLANPRVRETLRVDKVAMGVHRQALRVPLLTDLAQALGCIEVGEDALLAALSAGVSVAVVPDGTRGMGAALEDPPEESNKKDTTTTTIMITTITTTRAATPGLIRLAHAWGVRVVPVFFEGEAELCWTWTSEWRWVRWLRRLTRRWSGVPVPTLFVPRLWRAHQLTMHVGAPLDPADYAKAADMAEAYRLAQEDECQPGRARRKD